MKATKSWINTSQVAGLLDNLFADAAANDPLVHKAAQQSGALNGTGADFYQGMRKAYMAVGP